LALRMGSSGWLYLASVDSDLQAVNSAWSDLLELIRQTIINLANLRSWLPMAPTYWALWCASRSGLNSIHAAFNAIPSC